MRLNEILKTKYPIIQGGMANIATGTFAAAMSNAGALGLIATGGLSPEELRAEIRKCQELTTNPFGVNLMLMHPDADELAQIIVDENVKYVTTGAGFPTKYMKLWKEAGIIVAPVVSSSLVAKKMEATGADFVIAEGCESGGHVGEMTTMALVPSIVDAVSIPVVAAGGIADGRQLAAALALGACGVQLGTCLLVSEECPIHENYKQALLSAIDNDTIVTGRIAGTPVRVLKNQMSREYVKKEKSGVDKMELEMYTLGSLRKAVFDGNTKEGSLMAGQVCGQLHEIKPAAVILSDMMKEAGLEAQPQQKVALVTGASRGIGRAVCLRLAQEGMQVVFTYSSDEKGAKETVDCIQKTGKTAIAIKSNVAVEEDCKRVVTQVLEQYGRIDVLVNNAGITRDGLLMRMEEKDFDDVIDVNLKGTFLMTKEVIPAMLKKREGRIINISSVSGVLGNAGQTNYSASKAGVIGFTKACARELAGKKICVNAIAPGMIETDMLTAMTDKAKNQLSTAIPMKEMGLPEDVAGVVSFLCGRDSRYITGQVLCVDGGMAI